MDSNKRMKKFISLIFDKNTILYLTKIVKMITLTITLRLLNSVLNWWIGWRYARGISQSFGRGLNGFDPGWGSIARVYSPTERECSYLKTQSIDQLEHYHNDKPGNRKEAH